MEGMHRLARAIALLTLPLAATAALAANERGNPGASVSGTKTVAGSFNTGGTVTYTVILNNAATGAQPDNPGNEFTDVLPAGLTLDSAVATSGTASATVATNTVTWNGTIAPLGGQVTLTISATVNAGAGTMISNQGTISFDGDGNGTNESSTVTDDPNVGGATDATVFTSTPVSLQSFYVD
ncbi:DUF11 domain-containing protein [Tahibacter amnicola]|uniref:DUF11 domain-containing protein n=1 Tax=Tahibacter amnicola TaxID=2976241 RepID=A0ABY6BB15_9GAMM|nr:DUF11 domain-containing protein [Tahibacter amnicola]UXI67050.1 DUF11 domain-containing protein [Tahibacter amnicola]